MGKRHSTDIREEIRVSDSQLKQVNFQLCLPE